MNVLTRYIVKEILKASAVAVILLVTLLMLFTFSDELKDLGQGEYGLKEILMYLALTAPMAFYDLIPFGALLGSLFVVGSMANNREIVAMRAAGLSVFWIIKSVMLAGVVMVVVAFLVGEFVAPKAIQQARIIRMIAQKNEVTMRSRYGVWLKEKDEFINVRKIKGKDELAEIYRYKVNENEQLLAMEKIEEASYLGGGVWEIKGVTQSEVSSNQVFSSVEASGKWNTSIEPELLNVAVAKSVDMSLYELYLYIDFLKQNSQKSQAFELAFWSRLISPLVVFVMLMVSIPFVVGVHRGISLGGRMMAGIIIGIMFNLFDKIAGHLGLVYGFDPMIMAMLPSTVVFLSAVYAVSRVVR